MCISFVTGKAMSVSQSCYRHWVISSNLFSKWLVKSELIYMDIIQRELVDLRAETLSWWWGKTARQRHPRPPQSKHSCCRAPLIRAEKCTPLCMFCKHLCGLLEFRIWPDNYRSSNKRVDFLWIFLGYFWSNVSIRSQRSLISATHTALQADRALGGTKKPLVWCNTNSFTSPSNKIKPKESWLGHVLFSVFFLWKWTFNTLYIQTKMFHSFEDSDLNNYALKTTSKY